MDYKRILVPLDFSACSRTAFSHALALAEKFGSTVDVLHVWEPSRYVGPDVMLHLPGDNKSLADCVRDEARLELEKLLAQVKKPDTVTVNSILEAGDARRRIIELTESGMYDLVVMGTNGRTGLTRFVLGSVAENVVRRSYCPVLTVRDREDQQG